MERKREGGCDTRLKPRAHCYRYVAGCRASPSSARSCARPVRLGDRLRKCGGAACAFKFGATRKSSPPGNIFNFGYLATAYTEASPVTFSLHACCPLHGLPLGRTPTKRFCGASWCAALWGLGVMTFAWHSRALVVGGRLPRACLGPVSNGGITCEIVVLHKLS